MARFHLPRKPGLHETVVWPLARMVLYVLVGWIVLSVTKLFIGDPLTVYLESSRSDLIRTASVILSLAIHAFVGFVVLRGLRGLTFLEDRDDLDIRIALLRKYDEDWEDDISKCSEIMRVGSKSFYLASWLLPQWMRDPALALYSFCRKADDDIDEGDAAGAQGRLVRLHTRLIDAYEGRPAQNCVDRSFSAVVRAFEIPRELPEALLDGFKWDLDKVPYNTYSDVVGYSARVAAAVGGMMTVLMGGNSTITYARAFDLGIAMQLTNIARDVGEDARNGRLYLPAQWMQEEGLDPATFLADPQHSPALKRVIQRLLQRADELYVRADAGVSMLPRSCRVAIRAARLIYSDIGNKLQRINYNSVASRAVVSKKRKIFLALVASVDFIRPARPCNSEPVLPECQFLLDAVLPLCTAQHKEAPWTDAV